MNVNKAPAAKSEQKQELRFKRMFTHAGTNPLDEIEWEHRDATITSSKGVAVFSQKNVEVPKHWSQSATNIAVSKYFRGKQGTSQRETSVRQMISRVATTISKWGRHGNYFFSEEEAATFEAELNYILINQLAAFNSPVWFNVGVEEKPQTSACFINSVSDNMRSILNLSVTEGMLFKFGSGAGSNLSAIRSSKETLSSGGKASGPVSFMRGFDAFAGVIKSGGKTRRAAKMVILNADHPDIADFINSKANEEKKAWALIEAGYDSSIDGEAYGSVFFQNANHSVRASDEFMKAVESDGEWKTKFVTTGETADTYKARDVLRMISEATYICGDPGMQFDTTINEWNPVLDTKRINSSNPCSEYMFVDDSACNLASLNLMKFRTEEGGFDTEAFRHVSAIMILSQEIVIDYSSYPTSAIAQNSHDYRPLGIGYANLGALLMSYGLPYDSDEGRNCAAAITALLSGHTFYVSSLVAKKLGPFAKYAENKSSFLKVIGMHREKSYQLTPAGVPVGLLEAAQLSWDRALESGNESGYRNAQISVLAPTGTIGFLMDCDTTGIEPDIALVKYKWLVGGGMMKIVNRTVPLALARLGYLDAQQKDILDYIDRNDTIEGAPHISKEHLAVFDCAFKPTKGSRSIQYMGHIRMMSAVQPFISGAISKTVNMPNESTSEDIFNAYLEAWKSGVKAIAIYRDGSKRTQALTTSKTGSDTKAAKENAVQAQEANEPAAYMPMRRRLPDERNSVTHKFQIGAHEGYVTVGLFEDGTPGEMFITMAKEGSTISGMMDSFATMVSLSLQYGVPLKVLASKFTNMRFEPNGLTSNKNIRFAKSIPDYIFRWMGMKFLDRDDQEELGIVAASSHGVENGDSSHLEEAHAHESSSSEAAIPKAEAAKPPANSTKANWVGAGSANYKVTFDLQGDAPLCSYCGSITVRAGSCYKCENCGSTTGCG